MNYLHETSVDPYDGAPDAQFVRPDPAEVAFAAEDTASAEADAALYGRD